MKALNRRGFLKLFGAIGALFGFPTRSPAPASLMEAGAALCLVLTVTAAGIVCVVRLCRPKYILYFSVDEEKPTNGGRTYLCLSCSRAEAERLELTKCEGKFASLAECKVRADVANSNYLAFACGPVASDPSLRASITLETTTTPAIASSWKAQDEVKTMDLGEDDPSVAWTLPRQAGALFFRASATQV